MLIGYRARNHRQQVLVRGARPEVDDRATTPEVFDPLHARFDFTIDVAASERNRKLDRFYDVNEDGLARSWAGERVWCNPPYSNIAEWVEKAWAEAEAQLIVMLLPANRTEQTWWQTMVEPFRDRGGSRLHTEFLAGRLRFIAHDKDRVMPNERPPFGCVLLIFEHAAASEVSHAA